MRSLIDRLTGRKTKTGGEKMMSDWIYFAKRWTKESLNLSNLSLESLDPDLFKLKYLTSLNLSKNCLSSLPAEIKQLTRLKVLNLSYNQFLSFPNPTDLPPNLKKLIFRGNYLREIDFNDGTGIVSLIYIDLENNKIETFRYTTLEENHLKILNLAGNSLSSLNLDNNYSLEYLNLSGNNSKSFSISLSYLQLIKHIQMTHCHLIDVPSFILNCSSLETLDLSKNKLSLLPSRLANQTLLKRLLINDNELVDLPENLYQLIHMQELQVSRNKIQVLNPNISQLPDIQILEAFDNPIESPPKAVVEQGSLATIKFLKEIDVQITSGNEHRLWTSKLMIVGEGGVGKTSLIKALKGETYDLSEDTTHGININSIELEHPKDPSIQMYLNIWDFGGQQIYHATHQFFLTDNAIFIFVWNSRTEFNQGRPYYWLDMITANAPNAPIILVATHLDQRRESIPLDYLKEKYPQISSFFEVSNLDKKGIKLLYSQIIDLASNLPLMGKPWPEKWDKASIAVREKSEKLINRQELIEIFNSYDIDEEETEILARYLHDLGEILQYPESENLKDLVILKPQWISSYISKVITADSVLDSGGILTQQEISNQWSDLDKHMQEFFLVLMEQYDLAYQIPSDPVNRAIVVEQLHPDRPKEYQFWRQLVNNKKLKRVDIEYRLSSIQPGLPTWFIARSHRFSLGIHWRRGALFTDGKHKRNYALVESFEQEKVIRLIVIGNSPHNFLSILRDGLEMTFNRYPGMKVNSFVPCSGEDENNSCEGRFPYEKLEQALDRGLTSMQCQSCFSQIPLNQLLFGIGGSTLEVFKNIEEEIIAVNQLIPGDIMTIPDNSNHFESQVFLIHQIHRIVHQAISQQTKTQYAEFKEVRHILESISDKFDLLHRRFIAQFIALQKSSESHCPSTFLFRVLDQPANMISNAPLELHLLCQYPKQIHPATFTLGHDQKYPPYIVQSPKEWIRKSAPYIRAICQLISFAPIIPNSPLAETKDLIEKCLQNMEFYLEKVEQLTDEFQFSNAGKSDISITLDGSQLRAFRSLLNRLDPNQEWQGLKKWLSPEGHYLWLCPHHFNCIGKHFNEFQ